MVSYTGWGCIRYFDLGEHVTNAAPYDLARIPKLGAQWKVIHEFNPTEYLQDFSKIAIWVRFADLTCYSLAFSPAGVELLFEEEIDGGPLQQDIAGTVPDQLPPIGEWTRIEMTHAVDEETGRYFISVSFGDIEVMKVMRQLDPEILVMDATIGCGEYGNTMLGVMRGLVVLEKS